MQNLKVFIWISSLLKTYFIAVQLLSHVRLPVSPWTTVHKASLCFSISYKLLRFMSIDSVMLSNYFIIFCPPALKLSQHQGLFQRVRSLYQVTKILVIQLQQSQSRSQAESIYYSTCSIYYSTCSSLKFRFYWLKTIRSGGEEKIVTFAGE